MYVVICYVHIFIFASKFRSRRVIIVQLLYYLLMFFEHKCLREIEDVCFLLSISLILNVYLI